MPERIKSLLDKYSVSRLSEAIRNRKRKKMLDSITREVVERSGYDGRTSGIGNTDYPLVPMEKEIADYTPVGDAMQAIRAAGDALNGHLGKAVLGAGMLFVPNSIEKAAKPVIQSFKGGASRALRHAPACTIDYEDALLRPYKGQNFVHHDIDGEYVRDVLHGETRLMSPSLAVNRWGDYNDIYTPGFYGDHVLIGDRSMLENSRLFNGDGMTPTVREVWYGMDSVPSDMREKVSDDIWGLMERENVGKNVITDVKDLERLDLPFSDQYFEAKYHGTYPIENFRYGVFPEPKDAVGEKVLREFEKRGLPIETYKQVGGNEGYNNKVEAMLKVLNENQGLLFKCGGRKYPDGGKFFRTNLQNESPLMYQPMVPINYPVETPLRFRPQPDLGDYQAPASTGMVVDYPITLPERVPVTVQDSVSAPVAVEAPVENLFSDELVARRALKQRYAESAFNDKAKSKAGAQGAWQIMPITLKDYLGRGRGKVGDLNDPEYNRKVRDWVMGIIPRDLKEFWSESDSDRAKLAKLYAAYNWGAGNLRGFLRKKRDAGIDISNPDNWVDDLNPETRRYVKYLAFDEDIPDSTVYTNAAFEKAAAERGYANGGRLYEMGGPFGPINPNILRQAVKQTLLRAIPRNILVGAADLADNVAGIPSFGQIKEIPEAGKFYTDALDNGESEYYEDGYIENPGLTFLLDRGRQSEMLQKMGYHPVNDGYYGSVTSATRKLNTLKGDAIPIFQRGDDEVDFSEVEPVADKDGNYFFERTSYLGDIFGENELNHASYHPVSFYRHKGTGDIYVRGYDLNDYGKHDKNMWRNLPEAIGNSLFNQGYSYNKAGQTYGDEQYLAEIYDYIGNPFVQRTALVKAPEELVRKYFGEEYASGGKIRIKPENRGKFTALKKRTGHSASWFKAHGTPAQKKMAVFALNSRKWKHGDGGPIDRYSPEQIRAAIAKLKETRK